MHILIRVFKTRAVRISETLSLALSGQKPHAEHRRLRHAVLIVVHNARFNADIFNIPISVINRRFSRIMTITFMVASLRTLWREIECGKGHSFASSACSANLSAFQKQALIEQPLYRKLGHPNVLERFTLNNIHRNLCYVLPRNFHCRRCFLYPAYNTCRQIFTYSLHVQYMYTLCNILQIYTCTYTWYTAC